MRLVGHFLAIALFTITCESEGQVSISPSDVFDSLVCKCEMPKISDVGSGEVEFSIAFDWSEYRKSFRLLKEVPSQTDKIWRQIAEHVEDERYVSTVATGSGAKANLTVSSVSIMLARGTLTQPFIKAAPVSINPKIAASELNPHFFESPTKLTQWLNDRKDVPVYKLQIELCEWAGWSNWGHSMTVSPKRGLPKMAKRVPVGEAGSSWGHSIDFLRSQIQLGTQHRSFPVPVAPSVGDATLSWGALGLRTLQLVRLVVCGDTAYAIQI